MYGRYRSSGNAHSAWVSQNMINAEGTRKIRLTGFKEHLITIYDTTKVVVSLSRTGLQDIVEMI